jgi:hypothetical protein
MTSGVLWAGLGSFSTGSDRARVGPKVTGRVLDPLVWAKFLVIGRGRGNLVPLCF